MYFNITCPHCSKGLRVRDELAGRSARCPYCKNAVSIPEKSAPEPPAPDPFDLLSFDPLAPTAPAPTPPARTAPAAAVTAKATAKPAATSTPTSAAKVPARKRHEAANDDGTNVSLPWTALLGLGATFIFYLCLAWTPKSYFRDLFFERGWVTYAEAYFMFWSITILLFKSRKLMRQRESMLFDLLPESLGKDINQASLPGFVKHVRDTPVNTNASFLVRRVLRGLEHYSVRGSASEVSTILSSQSELDNAAVNSSYSLLNVFIWAIPILGFIGTVQGLGDAVGNLSGSLEGAADVESIKKSLGNITGGLGVAFDTTLVALIMSLFLKFPASSLQKAEEDLLNWVEEYCNENLLKRLQDAEGTPSGGGDAGLNKAVTAAMAPHHAELRAWSAKLKEIGKNITDEVAQGWSAIQADLQEKQQQQLTEVRGVIAAVGETTAQLSLVAETLRGLEEREAERRSAVSAALDAREAGLDARSAEHQGRIEATLADFAEQGKRAADEVAAHSAAAQAEIAAGVQQSTAALENHFALLRQAVLNLNEALGGLNGKQVVVQAVPPARKGWFGR